MKQISYFDLVDNGDGTISFYGSMSIWEEKWPDELHIGIIQLYTTPMMNDAEIMIFLEEQFINY